MTKKTDVAKLAGVSPATVSNYYTGKRKFSDETKKKITDAAIQLGYPLPEQQANTKKKLNTLLVVDDILNPHYGHILKGMISIASTHQIPVSMTQLWSNTDEFCDMIIAHEITAVYFATTASHITPQHLQRLRDHHVIVCFSWNNFSIDFDGLLDTSVKYLTDLGHRQIAYLSGSSIHDPENIRYHSYLKALENNHLSYDPNLVIDGIYPFSTDAKSGYWATRSFLSRNPSFTAIIALNDLLAIGSINALTEHGLQVPNDVSVIGCDDIMISEYVSPSLTTLHFSANDIGKRTMYSIIQKYNNSDSTNIPVSLQTQLVIRKSTGKAPQHPETSNSTG